MTNFEKDEILRLKKLGYGYKKISKDLNIPIGRVRRVITNNNKENGKSVSVCVLCGKNIVQTVGKRNKKFCSDKCRYQWWNQRKKEKPNNNYNNKTCLHCGKVFAVYGGRERKYCSRSCYHQDSLGRGENDDK